MENSEVKKEEAKEGKKLSKRDFILVIIVILFLSGATYWNFKNWRESLSKVEMPEIETPKIELFPKEEGLEEWTSPDGKLKMKYPADWMEMKSEVFKGFTQAEKGQALFFAQKFKFEKAAQAFLTVQRLKLEEEKSIDEIIEEMKKDVEKKEGEMEILNLEKDDRTAIFEAKYTGKTGPPLHSKEKIILDKERNYLASFSTFEKDWQEFQKEGEKIIDSVQLLE